MNWRRDWQGTGQKSYLVFKRVRLGACGKATEISGSRLLVVVAACCCFCFSTRESFTILGDAFKRDGHVVLARE
jgi:hypothetical protein